MKDSKLQNNDFKHRLKSRVSDNRRAIKRMGDSLKNYKSLKLIEELKDSSKIYFDLYEKHIQHLINLLLSRLNLDLATMDQPRLDGFQRLLFNVLNQDPKLKNAKFLDLEKIVHNLLNGSTISTKHNTTEIKNIDVALLGNVEAQSLSNISVSNQEMESLIEKLDSFHISDESVAKPELKSIPSVVDPKEIYIGSEEGTISADLTADEVKWIDGDGQVGEAIIETESAIYRSTENIPVRQEIDNGEWVTVSANDYTVSAQEVNNMQVMVYTGNQYNTASQLDNSVVNQIVNGYLFGEKIDDLPKSILDSDNIHATLRNGHALIASKEKFQSILTHSIVNNNESDVVDLKPKAITWVDSKDTSYSENAMFADNKVGGVDNSQGADNPQPDSGEGLIRHFSDQRLDIGISLDSVDNADASDSDDDSFVRAKGPSHYNEHIKLVEELEAQYEESFSVTSFAQQGDDISSDNEMSLVSFDSQHDHLFQEPRFYAGLSTHNIFISGLETDKSSLTQDEAIEALYHSIYGESYSFQGTRFYTGSHNIFVSGLETDKSSLTQDEAIEALNYGPSQLADDNLKSPLDSFALGTLQTCLITPNVLKGIASNAKFLATPSVNNGLIATASTSNAIASAVNIFRPLKYSGIVNGLSYVSIGAGATSILTHSIPKLLDENDKYNTVDFTLDVATFGAGIVLTPYVVQGTVYLTYSVLGATVAPYAILGATAYAAETVTMNIADIWNDRNEYYRLGYGDDGFWSWYFNPFKDSKKMDSFTLDSNRISTASSSGVIGSAAHYIYDLSSSIIGSTYGLFTSSVVEEKQVDVKSETEWNISQETFYANTEDEYSARNMFARYFPNGKFEFFSSDKGVNEKSATNEEKEIVKSVDVKTDVGSDDASHVLLTSSTTVDAVDAESETEENISQGLYCANTEASYNAMFLSYSSKLPTSVE
ncbi:hypothetical protein Cyrtocomes_00616 [Candidatus Cyrtobacter comes]|uniref:Uncharacterized protein n=1 Tax=Candidatus Cyrtobacter comes TaxID=675776 RepID=A0ABU5L7Y8_9RICK|nr:hypothetical protein [Candidatus Cyrtobacter comes]MDZ5762241.1 hypothetical protein [Candidatus Cyrtobacter comes]